MGNLIQTGTIITLPPFELTIDVNYAGVLTTFTYPAGTAFDSVVSLNDGVMNGPGSQWTIANYVKDFTSSITINVEVTDVDAFSALSYEDRKVVGDTTNLTGEIQLLDNVAEKLIEGITCVDVNDCVSSGLVEYASMIDAVADLGSGATFIAAEVNLHGWPYRAKFVTP
jgi:hypothetical protein